MRETSALYKALRNQPGYHYEVNVICNSTETVYGMSDLQSVHIKPMLFVENGPSIGNACSSECDITLRESSENWPRMAEYEVKVRVKSEDNSQYSEWLTLGTYFTDERSYTVSGNLSITGFDGMLKMETSWTDKITPPASWPITAKAWCDLIENAGLAEFDARNDINNSVAFVGLDTTSTIRDKLKDIAAAHGGNFVMTPEGKLRLIPFTNTIIYDTGAISGIAVAGIAIVGTTGDSSVNPNYSFLGMNCRSFSKSTPLSAVTGAELQTETGTKTTAGVDNGYVLKGNCNFASTNGVAALCLSRSIGYVYRGFESDTAYLDPASEPGDLVLFEDVAYQIMSLEWNINHRPTANISAPYEEEIDHEYEYLSENAKYYRKSVSYTDEQIDDVNYRIETAETAIEQTAESVSILATKTERIEDELSETDTWHNHIPFPYAKTGTVNMGYGITATFNDDGSITLNGDAGNPGASTYFDIAYNLPLAPGKYRLYLKQPSSYATSGVRLVFNINHSSVSTWNDNTGEEDGMVTNSTVFTYPEIDAGVSYSNSLEITYNLGSYDNYTIYPMISSGEDEYVWHKLSKNIMFYPYAAFRQTSGSVEQDGITFTNNGDGTIKLDGTATANGQIALNNLSDHMKLYNNMQTGYRDYIVSLSNTVIGNLSLKIMYDAGSGETYYTAAQTSSNIVMDDTYQYYDFVFYLSYSSGDVFDNVTVYPMIEFGSVLSTYEQPPDSQVVASRISEMEASLIVTAEAVESKVSKDGVISSINQSAEAITINANKLNLTGYLTATDVGSTGSTIIDGSRIYGGTLVLGGYNNQNGKLQLKDSNGTVIIEGNNNGLTVNGGTISGPTINGGTIDGASIIGTTIEFRGSIYGSLLRMYSSSSIGGTSVYRIDASYSGNGMLKIFAKAGSSGYSAFSVSTDGAGVYFDCGTYQVQIDSSGIKFLRNYSPIDSWT